MYKWKSLDKATYNVQGAIVRSLKYNVSGMLYTIHAIDIDGNRQYTIADFIKGYHYVSSNDLEYLDEPESSIHDRLKNFDSDEFISRAKHYPMS